MFSSKKGVSPLVATILLIAFAIALGAVVMSYGSAYYGSKQVGAVVTSPIEQCANVVLRVYEIAGKQQACHGGEGKNGFINFMLDNQGTVDIEEMLVTIIGARGSEEFKLNPFIGQGTLFDKRDRTTNYNFDKNGIIVKMQFRPYIRSVGKTQVCTDKQVLVENIEHC